MTPSYLDEGKGPPVLLLHGLMASAQVFRPLINLAKDRLRFLAIDLPHSGGSGAWAPMRPEPIAEGLERFLSERGIREVTVAGHSFGGLAALSLALRRKVKLTRVVLAGTPSVGLPAQAKQLLENPIADYGAAMLAQMMLPRRILRRYVEWLFGDPRHLTDEQLGGYAKTLSNRACWPSMLEATRSIVAWKMPQPLGVPTEVLWGDRDRLVPLVHGEQLAIGLDAGFTVLPGVGHCLPEEEPEVLLQAIEGRLSSRKAKDRYPEPR